MRPQNPPNIPPDLCTRCQRPMNWCEIMPGAWGYYCPVCGDRKITHLTGSSDDSQNEASIDLDDDES